MNTKIYIAGKVTGLLYHEAVVKFSFTEQELIAAGVDETCIVNPISHVPAGTSWKEAMDICIGLLDGCTAIYIQKDWRDSFGAKHEIKHAQQHRKDLYWEEMGDIENIKNLIATGV